MHNRLMSSAFAPITLGQQIRSRAIRGYVLTETDHPANRSLARHAHEHANIALIRRGEFMETIGHRTWKCAAGSAIFKPAGAEHANRYGATGMACLLIEILPDALETSGFSEGGLRETAVLHDGRFVELTATLCREIEASDSAASLAIEALVLQIMATMLRIRSPRERCIAPWLKTFRDALHERSDETIRITDLARELGVHPTHAVRAFRSHFGMTPGEYLRRIRVERACRLLRDGMSIADAAVSAGFAHQAHFSRLLKRYERVTPRQWLDLFR